MAERIRRKDVLEVAISCDLRVLPRLRAGSARSFVVCRTPMLSPPNHHSPHLVSIPTISSPAARRIPSTHPSLGGKTSPTTILRPTTKCDEGLEGPMRWISRPGIGLQQVIKTCVTHLQPGFLSKVGIPEMSIDFLYGLYPSASLTAIGLYARPLSMLIRVIRVPLEMLFLRFWGELTAQSFFKLGWRLVHGLLIGRGVFRSLMICYKPKPSQHPSSYNLHRS